MLGAHGEARRGLFPVAVSRFLSPHKKEIRNETERFSKAQSFIKVKLYTQIRECSQPQEVSRPKGFWRLGLYFGLVKRNSWVGGSGQS